MKNLILILLPVFSCAGMTATAQENSIRTFIPQVPLKETSSLPPSQSVKRTTLYLDGLGRDLQTVNQGASPGGGDIVKPHHYDSFGRQHREYLPYATTADKVPGAFRPDYEAAHAAYHRKAYSGDAYGYQQKVYESSALHLTQAISPPGKAWRPGSGRETKFHERPNLAEEQVRRWTVNDEGLPLTQESYAAGELWVSTITDGEGVRSLIYTDRLGREILKKTQARPNPSKAHAGWHCTYFVYDKLLDLRVVLPPKAVETLDGNWQRSVETDLSEGLFFLYSFDGLKRLIEKKSPGKEPEQFLYDRRGRQVGSRDGNLKASGQWRYTQYDVHNRPVQTGIVTDGRDRKTLQNDLDTESPRHDQPKPETGRVRFGQTITASSFDGHQRFTAAQAVVLKPGFQFVAKGNRSFSAGIGSQPEKQVTTGSFPRDEGEILTVSYYDDYSKSKKAFQEPASSSSPLPATGHYTGGLIRAEYLTERAIHYDKEGREILLLTEDHLGGETKQTKKYDFVGRLVETHTHIKGSLAFDYSDRYSYSPEGYLNAIYRRLAQEPETLLASYSYGLTGQLEEKHPGGLATFQYERHIQGWNSAIRPKSEDPGLFAMSLSYETGPQPLFNGNISEMVWSGRDQQQRSYRFAYDPAGRLMEALYTVPGKNTENDRYSLRGMRYDTNGNILGLTRHNRHGNDSFGEVDRLSYHYAPNSNLLESISDAVPDAGFEAKDFSSAPVPGDYRYDPMAT